MATLTLRGFVNDMDKIVQQAQGNMALKLSKGQCPNMESYHREVGRIEGMGIAVTTAREMLSQMEAAEQKGDLQTMDGKD
jgi:hypothetical protein